MSAWVRLRLVVLTIFWSQWRRRPVPDAFLELVVAPVGGDFQQVVVQGADVLVDGDLVVVENDEQVCVQAAGVVDAFEGQAAREGAVADDGDGVRFLPFELGGDGKAEGCGDRGGGMTCSEGVVRALVTARKAADAVVFPVLLEGFAAAGQDLVRIGLVPHVPHDFVFGGVEYVVDGHGDFHGAQAGTDVAGVLRTAGNDILAQLRAELCQLFFVHRPDAGGIVDRFEEGHAIPGLWSGPGRDRARGCGPERRFPVRCRRCRP